MKVLYTVGNFYPCVRSFYQAFIEKLISKFDFKSQIYQSLMLLDPSECQNLELSTFKTISESFTINFDLNAVKMEFENLQLIVMFRFVTAMVIHMIV